ncbi:MAG: hypothetical protein Kow0029_28810 [Candidatus Rifleibacteriota bacterium]
MKLKLYKEEIKLLRTAMYGRKSEKLPSDGNDQLTLDFGEEPTKPEESAAVEATPVKAHNRKKSGRKPLPEHLDFLVSKFADAIPFYRLSIFHSCLGN